MADELTAAIARQQIADRIRSASEPRIPRTTARRQVARALRRTANLLDN